MGHQAGGPDVEPNGLSLCTLHHKAFDLGVYSLNPKNRQLIISQELVGGAKVSRMLDYHGKVIASPQSKTYLPKSDYLKWHNEHIFKHPAREL